LHILIQVVPWLETQRTIQIVTEFNMRLQSSQWSRRDLICISRFECRRSATPVLSGLHHRYAQIMIFGKDTHRKGGAPTLEQPGRTPLTRWRAGGNHASTCEFPVP
jgi:hypothetical protein